MITAIVLPCTSTVVHDGGLIRCPGGRGMRLAPVDAPELAISPRCHRPRRRVICDQAAVIRSRDHLRRLVVGRTVSCRIVDAGPMLVDFQHGQNLWNPQGPFGRSRC